jgi:hypothetical protein
MAHGPWQRWSMVDWATADRRGLPELGLAAASGHGGSPAMAQRRERSTGSSFWASPGRGRWHGDWATAVKKWQRKLSVWAPLGRGEKRRRTGRGAVEDGEADEALTWAQEAVRWPGDDGKAAVA